MSPITRPGDIVRQDVLNIFKNSSRLPEPLRNAHIYITGGAGFLGTWLLEIIAGLNDGHDFNTRVTIASRSFEQFTAMHLHLAKRKEFTFVPGDVRFLLELPNDVTHIIHAAAYSNKNQFATYPTVAFENNIDATLTIFRLAQQLGSLQNILLMSSSLVYGKQPAGTTSIKEDSFGASWSPFDTNSIYAESKRACEAAAAGFLSEMKLPVSIARPFSFVGPYQSLDLPWAVTDFMRDAFHGGPIKIMSNGSIYRSIMYAADFANWILHITAYASPRSAYNVGSPESADLLSLAKLIGSFAATEPKIITSYGNNVSLTDRSVVPNVDKAVSELQLKVTVGLEAAIERSMQWYSGMLKKH